MTAVGAAVRLPDQFRPSRGTPMAATPSCCCCCCCCFATLITSSVVLPMRVELLAREAPSVPKSQVTASKALAALAPVTAFAAAVAVGWATDASLLFLVALVLVLAGMLVAAFAPFGQQTRSVSVTAAFVGAFAAELVVGFVGILGTAGIGYLAVVVFAGITVFRAHKRLLAVGPASASPGEGSPPPPLPRPPSIGDDL